MTEPRPRDEVRSGSPLRQELAVYATCDGRIRARRAPRLRAWSRVVLIGAFMSVAGCGGESRLVVPSTPSAMPSSAAQVVPPAAATPAVQPTIGDVIWTTAIDATTGEPTDVVTEYLPDAPRLVAATKATALPAGSRVEAAWSYNDTPLEPFGTRLSADNGADGQWLNFYLRRDPATPWPAGLYEIAISLDGTPMRESVVAVVAAD